MKAPKIRTITAKKLVGLSIEHSLEASKARQMWSQFMPQVKHIHQQIAADLFSVQIYPSGLSMNDFAPTTLFQTWAAIEVDTYENLPEGLNTFDLQGGLYAVFLHRGAVDTFPETANYIFGNWLPQSDYQLDDRAHFEVLDKRFLGPDNPESEEEVWIPIRLKN